MIYIFQSDEGGFQIVVRKVCKVEIKALFACLMRYFTGYYYIFTLLR